MTRRTLALAVLLACTERPQKPFAMPRNIEDLRMRLLTYIPEGREMPEAVQWMTAHGFSCAGRVCRIASDGGIWTVTLKERAGRLADVEVR